MRRVLVDTSAYADLLRGSREVLGAIGRAEQVHLSVIVLGELYAGFRGGSQRRENERLLQRFLTKPTVEVLPVTAETAECFGQIRDDLCRAGTPIPMNDVWLAAQALETGSVVLSYDRHFLLVPGLRVWPALAGADGRRGQRA